VWVDGVSGREDAVVEMIRIDLEGFADEIKTDAMKNITAAKYGTQGENRPRIMLAGHIG
jgi:putative aminopeptidase FrvX